MTQQHIQKLVESLRKQGCRIRETKGGVFIYCPNGVDTLGFHTSKHSDVRALRNLKASVKRAGLEWPKGMPG